MPLILPGVVRRPGSEAPGKLLGGSSGWVVDRLQEEFSATHRFGGYAIFFVYTTVLGLPALVLAAIVRRHFEKETPPSGPKEG